MGLLDKLFGKSDEADNGTEEKGYIPKGCEAGTAEFVVVDLFPLKTGGTVVAGVVTAGTVSKGDEMALTGTDHDFAGVVEAMELYGKPVKSIPAVSKAAILFKDLKPDMLKRNDVLKKVTKE